MLPGRGRARQEASAAGYTAQQHLGSAQADALAEQGRSVLMPSAQQVEAAREGLQLLRKVQQYQLNTLSRMKRILAHPEGERMMPAVKAGSAKRETARDQNKER